MLAILEGCGGAARLGESSVNLVMLDMVRINYFEQSDWFRESKRVYLSSASEAPF